MIKNNWNNKKSLNSYDQNFQEKYMKHVIKMKKKGYKSLTNAWRQKNLENFEEENDKNHLDWIGRRNEERKSSKSFWE